LPVAGTPVNKDQEARRAHCHNKMPWVRTVLEASSRFDLPPIAGTPQDGRNAVLDGRSTLTLSHAVNDESLGREWGMRPYCDTLQRDQAACCQRAVRGRSGGWLQLQAAPCLDCAHTHAHLRPTTGARSAESFRIAPAALKPAVPATAAPLPLLEDALPFNIGTRAQSSFNNTHYAPSSQRQSEVHTYAVLLSLCKPFQRNGPSVSLAARPHTITHAVSRGRITPRLCLSSGPLRALKQRPLVSGIR
jgi:hypothetical protein